MNRQIKFIDLGKMDYKEAWDFQEKLFDEIVSIKKENRKKKSNLKTPNYFLFVEHPHVYTLGKSGDISNLLINEKELKNKNASFYKINRGGDITYHGPGQIVGYPIINLNHFKKSVSWYMRSLEKVIIMTLDDYNITAERKDGMTGVWVDDEKICAMGVRLSRWVTMHGFALNLIPKMEYYDSMIPCGIQEYGITSMSDILSEDIPKHEVIESLSTNFTKIFNIEEI